MKGLTAMSMGTLQYGVYAVLYITSRQGFGAPSAPQKTYMQGACRAAITPWGSNLGPSTLANVERTHVSKLLLIQKILPVRAKPSVASTC